MKKKATCPRFSKNDKVLVTSYIVPRYASILKQCSLSPDRWVVVFENGEVKTVRERYLKPANDKEDNQNKGSEKDKRP